MHIYAVAVPVPLYSTFHYTADKPVAIGSRVLVNFANRKVVGIIWQVASEAEITAEVRSKLKPIEAVLDGETVFTEKQQTLLQWLASYYHAPLGEVCHTALPVALRRPKGALLLPEQVMVRFAKTWQRQLASGMSAEELWQAQGWRAAAQQQALLSLLASTLVGSACVLLSQIKAQFKKASIDALLDKGVIETVSLPTQAGIWQRPATHWQSLQTHSANVQQALAITGISAQLDSYGCFLLEGVTGSGKTEVYLQIIAQVLAKGRQVLVLVPEIGLTPQTVARFEQRLGIEIGVIHSGLSDNARLKVWQQAREQQIGLVIGTRSAVFTPMPALGMIIIDEEHDDSFKQQDGVRYHARAMAIMLAHQQNIPIVLGSATPTADSLHNAQQGKYQHFSLDARAGSAQMASQELVDITQAPLQAGLAPQTIETMQQHLARGNQVLVFLNRRGFAPAVVCDNCGQAQDCVQCDKPYTYHRAKQRLICHHCGDQQPTIQRCQHCGHPQLYTQGLGTEQLTEQVAQMFPQYSTIRIDSDSMRGKDKLTETLDDINAKRHQILVGTQILAKGHHFENVTCVVIMDVDAALFSPDFRATESLAQLITQISGRAGRGVQMGQTLLQTTQPGHPLLQDLLHNGYGHFIRTLLIERQAANLPPYSHQTLLRAEDPDARKCLALLNFAAQQCQGLTQIQLVGPMPGLLEKKQGRYRYQLLLQAQQRPYLQGVLKQIVPQIQAYAQQLHIRWSIDVDNIDFS